MKELFIWTECFNCTEIAIPMLESLVYHNPDLEINVYCFRKELCEFETLDSRVKLRSLDNSILNRTFRRDETGVSRGYKVRSHLGTARAWANIIANNHAKYYLHLDADQIFLSNLIDEIVFKLREGFDLVGTRRPYFHRPYRKTGKVAFALDEMPDAVNTDLLGFSRNVMGNLWSPLAVRRIRGRRTSLRPVIDFFDPIFFRALDRGAKVFYLDSGDTAPRGETNFESVYYQSRILFAAVGSGMHFWRNPDAISSPGYKEFALESYSLWHKYMKGSPIGHPTLEAPELEGRLKRLNRREWKLKPANEP